MNSPTGQIAKSNPNSPENGGKSVRYDRQVRLWGQNGQVAIESGKVCLIQATAVGTELVKCLVLAGIGSFTIVDERKLMAEDVGSNFFLTDPDSVGQRSRGEVAARLLMELNPEVRGDYMDQGLEAILESNPQFFADFDVVVLTGFVNEKSLVNLSKLLWEYGVPMMVCKSIGLIGYVRVQVKEHNVIESHPDNSLDDLRLDNPFPELKDHLDNYPILSEMSRKDLVHTPYLVILYKYLKMWQQLNGKGHNDLPANYKEKNEFKNLIVVGRNVLKARERSKRNDEEVEVVMDNFDEAIQAVNKSLVSSVTIPNEIRELMEASRTVKITGNDDKSGKFWLLIRALDEFVRTKNDNQLPVRGTIPDMISDSRRYIDLQRIYAGKAKQDSDAVYSCFQRLCSQTGLSSERISDTLVRLLCKNSHAVRRVATTAIFAEYFPDSLPSQFVQNYNRLECDTEDRKSEFVFYLMLRSVDRFFTQCARLPGLCEDDVESDVPVVKACLSKLAQEMALGHVSRDNYVHEVCRYGGAELNSIASFVGGTAAQEAIKLITQQYVPLNNTLIYNAIDSTTATYTF